MTVRAARIERENSHAHSLKLPQAPRDSLAANRLSTRVMASFAAESVGSNGARALGMGQRWIEIEHDPADVAVVLAREDKSVNRLI